MRVSDVRDQGSTTARTLRVTLADGARTTVHVAEHDRRDVRLHVRRLPGLTPLEGWCRVHGVREALVGGFYLRGSGEGDAPPGDAGPNEGEDPTDAVPPAGAARRPDDARLDGPATGVLQGRPLGELRIDGAPVASVPFLPPWGARRACVHVTGERVDIRRRDALPAEPAGDLLQAGPLLVRAGCVVTGDDEGFSAGSAQFDSDITAGRHPRAALGVDGDRLVAVACDGRAADEAGLGIAELAELLVELGVRDALNLDGGGSTALVSGGRLRNVARGAYEVALPGGREIATALEFRPL